MKKVICLTLNILFFFLLVNKGYSLNKKMSVVQNELKKIDLVYYDRFPYKKSYDGIKAPECIRSPVSRQQTGSVFLLCREHITLLRPASVIRLWQRQQRLKGYIPFSMKEFGIFNVHAYITGVKKYISVTKNNIIPDSVHVTGKFIRYTREVNRYIIKDKQTNAISVINATPNHPFYVINKHKFIPISKISLSDSLVTLSNHPAYLMFSSSNDFSPKTGSKKNKLTHVYNIEIEKKHIYFISKLNILVHNPCESLKKYYNLLKGRGIIQEYNVDNTPCMRIMLKRKDIGLLSESDNINKEEVLNEQGQLRKNIRIKIHRLGFDMMQENEILPLEDPGRIDFREVSLNAIFTCSLRNPASRDTYEKIFIPGMPDYDALLQSAKVSSSSDSEANMEIEDLSQDLSDNVQIPPLNTAGASPVNPNAVSALHRSYGPDGLDGDRIDRALNPFVYMSKPYGPK